MSFPSGPNLGMDGFSSGADGAWSQEAAAGVTQPAAGNGGGGGEPPTVDAAFKLQAEEGATVSATFPFFGDPEGGQLSFQIGDHIKVSDTSFQHAGGAFTMLLHNCGEVRESLMVAS